MHFKSVFLGMLALLFSMNIGNLHANAQEEWTLPVPDFDRSPYSYAVGDHYEGIHIELMDQIAKQIGVVLKKKAVPVIRRRENFIRGKVDLECCVNPIWRNQPEEKEIQIFSDPLYHGRDIYVFKPGSAFAIPDVTALKGKTVIGIKGYSYIGEENYGARIDVREPLQILKMVASGRADTGILQEDLAHYLTNKEKIAIDFGPLQHSRTVHIRLHKSKAAYLPAINKAIAEMTKNGEIDRIFKKYISPQ